MSAVLQTCLERNPAVRVLTLDHCTGLAGAAFPLLMKSLQDTSSVTRLSLAGCGLGADEADALGAMLGMGISGISLCDTYREVAEIRISDNPLGDKGVAALGQGLLECECLTALDLSRCGPLSHSLKPRLSRLGPS
jgi:hypothetical protein